MNSRVLISLAAVTVAAAASLAAGAAGASAGVSQPSVVSATPAKFTPNLASDTTISHPAAYALEQSPDGTTMYVGGQFDAVQDSALDAAITRQNFVAFGARDGVISGAVTPAFNGPVWAIRSTGTALYVAGEFTTVKVGGSTIARRGLVKLDPANGAVDPRFTPPWKTGKAFDLQVVGDRLVVAGTFAGALLALNLATGADTGFLTSLKISGTCSSNAACGTQGAPPTGEPTQVYRFAVSAGGTRLVAIGNFVTPHPRAFMVDLTTGSVAAWFYPPLAHTCALPKVYPAYLRDVDFAPNSSYFVIVGTGGVPSKTIDPTNPRARPWKPGEGGVGVDVCDAAARFNTDGSGGPTVYPDSPTWINYTGGDTLHSVNVTGVAVYVNGHNRWLDNPNGHDTCLGTCVDRPGIGAIDPVTGRAADIPWNPGKTRGVGGKDLLSTSQGLWVASDGQKIAGKFHYGIALMPLLPSTIPAGG